MTSERAEQGATPDNHQRQPGATLAAQRESLGWTVEQVAEQLKLAVRQVVAIEKGDYAALPSPAVTRGFVRAYAKILRLDPAPLVAMVPMDNPVPEDTGVPVRRDRQTSFSHSRYPTHGKRSNLPLAWIAGVAVVAAAGAAVWHFGLVSRPGSDTSNRGAASGAGNGEAVLGAPAEAPAAHAPMPDTVLNPSVPLISVPGPAASTGNAAPAAPSPAPAAVPPAAVATPPATTPAATPAATAPAAGANTLVLNVREDSWIEVRPQGGKAVISRLVKAGSTETVEVPGGATLTVGNPGGVSATLRGAAVALPPVPGKTISRVTLK
ncbi:MAG: helix-turn-helix domain-containing protein [Telluria sp.]